MLVYLEVIGLISSLNSEVQVRIQNNKAKKKIVSSVYSKIFSCYSYAEVMA